MGTVMGARKNTFLIVPAIVVTALLSFSTAAQGSGSGMPAPTPTPTATPKPTPTPTPVPTATPKPTPTSTPVPTATPKPTPTSTPVPTATPVPTPTPPPGTKPGTTVDVTKPGSSGTINGAIFSYSDQQSTATGSLDPFLQVQHTLIERGYNTDGGFPFGDNQPSNLQHGLLQSSLAVFTINGVQYYKFILNSNQSGVANQMLAVGQLQIYTSNNGAQTTQTFNSDGTLAFDATTHLAYNLNIGGLTSNHVITNAAASGVADMYAYIPVSDFIKTDKYIILYFFAGSNYTATGGSEEWVAVTVPENGPTLVLSFIGVGALFALRSFTIRNRNRQPDPRG